ncbi:type VI secretion system ATPase TssH [Roseibium sp. RKSG952]|uniref:type VI secretion system ATPase TssH n=1 Tax=Roseibium sp. RKSG952 TaxID=2529384 RepID=UPI0012BCC9F4|nr:type VI secretion system ATPase TssH [Roseibium sp. RKSG952]MTI00409.1 type VI secretion system ATPase TssH [Roseibium sp. RKSG952]
MTDISRVALFGKLNQLAYQSIESATVFCKMRGNAYVELAHWIHQILQQQDSDLHHLAAHYDLDPSRLAADLTRCLDTLPRGATSISDLSPHLEEATERAWVYASLLFGKSEVRTGHLVVGLLKTQSLRNQLIAMSQEFGKIRIDDLCRNFAARAAGSPENDRAPKDGNANAQTEPTGIPPSAPAQLGGGHALARFCSDLTEKAGSGDIDPIVGRDAEIRQMIDILMRRRQNNPILTGEAGVGKTAAVEGLALRIVRKDVPPALRNARLLALDVGLLQAGASMKGEFENRLRSVLEDVQASPVPVVLFVDETHTLVGAGGAEGTGDAANLLKPALARGTLRTIGATTWSEYKKHIEKDPALTRRFQVVQVAEPDEARAVMMIRGTASSLESHHKVQILDEALEASVKLSARYIPARQLPDKAVSVLDTACARVAISLHAQPAPLDDCQRRIDALKTELDIISRDETAGARVAERRERAAAGLAEETGRLDTLIKRWDAEKTAVNGILDLRAKLRALGAAPDQEPEKPNEVSPPASAGSAAAQADLFAELRAKMKELNSLQDDDPLVLPIVDAAVVASVISDWTGIPVGRMVKDEIRTVLNLARHLSKRVIGQDHAMEMIARRVKAARAGLDNPSKPVGVFLLAGTSGVGKTETALALAETLYGGEQNVITINMSEYQEAHTVSSLKGAPPGYVGYGEGGVLTEAVRRKPYSVILLDEVEKAHPDVHEVFFQVFDKGQMEDGEGRMIDFRNTLILLTSNVGSDVIMDLCSGSALTPEPDSLAKALRGPLMQVFPPALLGRMVTIPYYPLSRDMISQITRLQLERIKKRVEDTYDVPFSYSDGVVDTIVARCQDVESGGRMIDAIITNTMLPAISTEFLSRKMEDAAISSVGIDISAGEFTYQIT